MTDKNSLVIGGQESLATPETSTETIRNLDELFSKVSIEEENGFNGKDNNAIEDSKVVDDAELETGVPKIFPWEYRAYKPERVWE